MQTQPQPQLQFDGFWHNWNQPSFRFLLVIRKSVIFKDSSESGVKGIDISGPPSQPRPFVIIDAADVIVESDDDDDDDDELNNAMIDENEQVDQEGDEGTGPGEFGDN